MTELAYQETLSCVQCGYCLPTCPTYITFKKETHSPRGRINLVKMAAEGKITYDDMTEAIDLCLGCRACETACPTNVQYGKILESAIEVLAKHKNEQLKSRVKVMKSLLFNQVVPNEQIRKVLGAGLAFYQKTGLQKVAHKTGVLRVLPENLHAFETILPTVEGPIKRSKRERFYEAATPQATFKIGFFVGCIMDTMFSSINTLSMKLLQQAGCEVTVIQEQGCCGALHQHSGLSDKTRELAKRNIEAFERYDFDYIVNSIGGCGAMLGEYPQLLDDSPEWVERAEKFSEKSVDISVILSQLSLPYTKPLSYKVTYQPSCHMTNVQKRVNEPLQMIQSIPGIDYIPLPDAHMCCGSAGIYNIVRYNHSMKILDEKMKHVEALTEPPSIIVTTNPGCHLQMKLGAEREGLSQEIRVVHLVELLAEACSIEA
ncbi:(Fe-S)-binding protein [Solibacillus sp. CAU 1738]|uniref:(Fe-S)-binding protein n=1 Tax=Solibacillus sp. CAU 1738 TaxID=3140363 RepID=UPI00326179B2